MCFNLNTVNVIPFLIHHFILLKHMNMIPIKLNECYFLLEPGTTLHGGIGCSITRIAFLGIFMDERHKYFGNAPKVSNHN